MCAPPLGRSGPPALNIRRLIDQRASQLEIAKPREGSWKVEKLKMILGEFGMLPGKDAKMTKDKSQLRHLRLPALDTSADRPASWWRTPAEPKAPGSASNSVLSTPPAFLLTLWLTAKIIVQAASKQQSTSQQAAGSSSQKRSSQAAGKQSACCFQLPATACCYLMSAAFPVFCCLLLAAGAATCPLGLLGPS